MKFSVENGYFSYPGGRQVLKNINFDVQTREILSILGPNGVGKTTLLKCTLGLLQWHQGETLIDGENIAKMKYCDIWKSIGYVPQAKLSAFAYTVDEMVLLGRNSHLKYWSSPGKQTGKSLHSALSVSVSAT